MKSINLIKNDYTILIIAHRVSTLKECDLIVELGKTGIIRSGSYNELSKQ